MKNLIILLLLSAIFSPVIAANSDGSGTEPESLQSCNYFLIAASEKSTNANSDGSGTFPGDQSTEANSDGSGNTPEASGDGSGNVAKYLACIYKI